MPPTPVAAPPKRESVAWRRLAICASSAGEWEYIRLRSATHAAAAGACRSDAASAMCSGRAGGIVAQALPQRRRQLALRSAARSAQGVRSCQ